MKQTEQQRQAAPQAAGVVIEAAAGKIWAAVVRRNGSGFERTYQATFDLKEGLESIVEQIARQAGGAGMPIVVGLESSRLRFLEMTLPPVDATRLPLLIRTQAEAQLPLGGDQMQLAWRMSPGAQGVDCTVAAVRRDTSGELLDRLGIYGPVTAVVPDAAGFAQLRLRFFSPTPQTCVVLRQRADGFAVMLLEGASLVRCAVIGVEPSEAAKHPALAMQDIVMELDAIEKKCGRKVPICLWPGDEPFIQIAADSLRHAGWEAAALEANQGALEQAKLGDQTKLFSPSLDAAGLAILALSETTPGFDFLQVRRMAQPLEDAKKQKTQRVRTLGIIVLLLLLCVAVDHWSLKLQVSQLSRELAAEADGVKAETLLQRQNYQEAAARARLDVLELTETIQNSREGLVLDSLEFEMKKPVKLTATAGDYAQVYGFQKRLETQNGVSAVRLIDPRMDERTKQVRFTMQFHYKHFTK